MTGFTLPTRENPRFTGRHKLYYHGEILVIVYSGDLAPDEVRAMIELRVESGKRVFATVTDVEDLGSFGPETRKVFLSKSATKLLQSETVPVAIFVVNADLVRRATMRLATLAARLLSKRAQRVYFLTSREEAEERAAAYHAEHAGETEDASIDPP